MDSLPGRGAQPRTSRTIRMPPPHSNTSLPFPAQDAKPRSTPTRQPRSPPAIQTHGLLSPTRQRLQALDLKARHALTAHHFQSDFDAKDFVERVSGSLVVEAKRNAKQYEAKAFIRNFEIVSSELIKLQKEIEVQMREGEMMARTSESEYQARVNNLRQAFKNMTTQFESLEKKINSIGSTAVRVGEQLESIDRERTRASDIEHLVDYFIEFSRGKSTRLEDMLVEGGPNGQCKAAIIMRRLNAIVQDGGDFGASDQAKTNIEFFCERLERDLLDSFDRSYRQHDITTMANCARALIEFNGGASCVQTYVNQHEFFMNLAETQVAMAQQSYKSLGSLNDLYNPPAQWDAGLSPFFRSISKMLRHEWSIISAVFPNALAVMQVLAQRVFAQSVQNYLENILHLGERDSQLAYLRVLAASHAATKQLVQELQQFDQEVMAPFISAQQQEDGALESSPGGKPYTSIAYSTILLGTQSAASFSITLDRCMDDLFVPYIENKRYIDAEIRFLLAAFQTTLARFLGYVAQRKAQKPKNMISRTLNQITGSGRDIGDNANGNPTTSPSLGGSGHRRSVDHGDGNGGAGYGLSSFASSIAQFAGKSHSPTLSTPGGAGGSTISSPNPARSLSTANQQVLADAELENDDTLPTVNRAIQILKVHAEAIARCVELSIQSDIPKSVGSLFTTLTDFLVTRYMDPAVELALDELTDTPKGQEPDFRSFYTLKVCNQVVHLVQCHFQTWIVPLVSSSPGHYRDIMTNKNDLTATVEQHLNQLALRQISAAVTFINSVLSKQRKQDYRPREEDFQPLSLATETCETIVDFLGRLQRTVVHCFDSENRDQFLFEVGNTLHGLLLDHYKNFTISVLGGLVVSEDIAKYQEAVKRFHLSALDEKFSALRNIGTLFLVRADVLQSLLDEDTDLGRMDRKFLTPYLQMREDYRSGRIADIIGLGS
ncbi:Exocyst complex component 5 [Dispira simplex]|nr:Exocyst complex component 5 [Dispira simplex]